MKNGGKTVPYPVPIYVYQRTKTHIHLKGVKALSVNKKTHDTVKRAGTFVFSVLCGMLSCGVLLLLFSAVMYVLGLLPEIAGVLALVSFAAGCLLAGFICGSIKQHGGLKAGLICALLMTSAVVIGSLFTGGFSGGSALVKLISAVISSCTGAVLGVNRK